MTIPPPTSVPPRSSDCPAAIVLVEDDEDLAAVMVESLAAHGYRVTVSRNAHEAEHLLGDDAMGVLVTDFSLPPGADGLSIIRRVRADPSLAHVAIVLATGHPDARQLEQAALTLAAAFVPKPFDIHLLLAAIERARTLVPPRARRAA